MVIVMMSEGNLLETEVMVDKKSKKSCSQNKKLYSEIFLLTFIQFSVTLAPTWTCPYLMRLSLRIWQRPGRCWSWWRWWRRSWSRCCTSRWSGWTRPCTSWGRQGGRESVTWGKRLCANIVNIFFLQTFMTKYRKAAVLRTKNELLCTSLICPCMTWMRWSWRRWWWWLCNDTGLP